MESVSVWFSLRCAIVLDTTTAVALFMRLPALYEDCSAHNGHNCLATLTQPTNPPVLNNYVILAFKLHSQGSFFPVSLKCFDLNTQDFNNHSRLIVVTALKNTVTHFWLVLTQRLKDSACQNCRVPSYANIWKSSDKIWYWKLLL